MAAPSLNRVGASAPLWDDLQALAALQSFLTAPQSNRTRTRNTLSANRRGPSACQ